MKLGTAFLWCLVTALVNIIFWITYNKEAWLTIVGVVLTVVTAVITSIVLIFLSSVLAKHWDSKVTRNF